jgi:hypothetical protein
MVAAVPAQLLPAAAYLSVIMIRERGSDVTRSHGRGTTISLTKKEESGCLRREGRVYSQCR